MSEVLKIENVRKYFGKFAAVDDISFSLKEGGIFLLGQQQRDPGDSRDENHPDADLGRDPQRSTDVVPRPAVVAQPAQGVSQGNEHQRPL